MHSTLRSDSYAESVKHGVHDLSAIKRPQNRQLKQNDDLQRRSLYYPTSDELSPGARTVRGTACTY